jgi:hypothetical protein
MIARKSLFLDIAGGQMVFVLVFTAKHGEFASQAQASPGARICIIARLRD